MASRGVYPLPKFHFVVKIGNTTVPCQEVSGLDQSAEYLEYRHGNSPEFVTMKRIGMVKTNNLTLKKAVFKGDKAMLTFFEKIYEKEYYSHGNTIDLVIHLLDEKKKVVLTWKVLHAVPVKLGGTDLKSTGSSEVAVESIEFVHEGIRLTYN